MKFGFFVVLLIAAFLCLRYFHKNSDGAPLSPAAVPVDGFRCEGKVYCSQMTSCSEALFYLKNCPGTKMDGDGDKIPCEKEWCGRSVSQANHFN